MCRASGGVTWTEATDVDQYNPPTLPFPWSRQLQLPRRPDSESDVGHVGHAVNGRTCDSVLRPTCLRLDLPRDLRPHVLAVDDLLDDCSGVSDGSAAAAIYRTEDAHKYNDDPIFIKALSFVAGPSEGPKRQDGRFDLDGDQPVDPDGELKSFGHPIGTSGLRMMYEMWLQLRGEAGERQIADPKLGLTDNLGGAPGRCVSFVSVVGL